MAVYRNYFLTRGQSTKNLLSGNLKQDQEEQQLERVTTMLADATLDGLYFRKQILRRRRSLKAGKNGAGKKQRAKLYKRLLRCCKRQRRLRARYARSGKSGLTEREPTLTTQKSRRARLATLLVFQRQLVTQRARFNQEARLAVEKASSRRPSLSEKARRSTKTNRYSQRQERSLARNYLTRIFGQPTSSFLDNTALTNRRRIAAQLAAKTVSPYLHRLGRQTAVSFARKVKATKKERRKHRKQEMRRREERQKRVAAMYPERRSAQIREKDKAAKKKATKDKATKKRRTVAQKRWDKIALLRAGSRGVRPSTSKKKRAHPERKALRKRRRARVARLRRYYRTYVRKTARRRKTRPLIKKRRIRAAVRRLRLRLGASRQLTSKTVKIRRTRKRRNTRRRVAAVARHNSVKTRKARTRFYKLLSKPEFGYLHHTRYFQAES